MTTKDQQIYEKISAIQQTVNYLQSVPYNHDLGFQLENINDLCEELKELIES